MAKGRIITFDRFDRGEFGETAPWRAPVGSFTGLNVVVYTNGAVGPRNGLKAITVSGMPTATIVGMGHNNAAREANLNANWVIQGTAVRFFKDDGTGLTTAGTALAVVPPEPPAYITKERLTYISVVGDKLYKLDHNTNSVTAIATPNSPGARCLAQYGERTMAGGPGGKAPDGTTAPQNRVYFSDAGNPESWPATNFFDIGDQTLAVTAIIPQRGHVVFATSDGGWWVGFGVPGTDTFTLRGAGKSVSPFFPNHGAQLGNGLIGFVVGGSTDTGSADSLGLFSGSAATMVDRLRFGNGRRQPPLPTYQVVPLKEVGDWFVLGGPGVADRQLALYARGRWTLHQFNVPALYAFVNSQTVADAHMFSNGNGQVFYTWRAYNDRPAFTSDTFGQPGDGSTTPFTARFTLPEWYAPDGGELSVTEVVVDFTGWNTGSPSTNHFDVVVRGVWLYEDGESSATVSFDEPGSNFSTSGTRRRKRFSFSGAAPEGNGFQITIDNIRGVAIHKISARVMISEPRF